MKTSLPSLPAVARLAAPSATGDTLAASFSEQLSNLYGIVQRSHYVFGSPIGPFYAQGRSFNLPRFVYFGPHTSDAALKIAFHAGHDHRELRPTLALLRLVEGLALNPDVGQGLNLSFFPLLDVLGLAQLAPGRRLDEENWNHPTAPEIALLEKDARVRGYHGFVRLETAPGEEDVVVRLHGLPPSENLAPALELISSDDVSPFPVRWESRPFAGPHRSPLAISDDLPLRPFELTVRLPAAWSVDLFATAAASILKRFVIRYRGFISYAQHL